MRSSCLYEEFPALDVVLHAQPEEVTEDGFCIGVPLDDAILIEEYHVSCNAADLIPISANMDNQCWHRQAIFYITLCQKDHNQSA